MLPRLPLLLTLTACAAPTAARTVVTMGTPLRVRIEAATDAAASRAAELCVRAVEDADRRWSSWRPDSLLQRVHSAPPGVAVPVDAAFCRGLELARRWSERTSGAFDPGAGALLELWGVRTGGVEEVPGRTDLLDALAATGVRHFEVRGESVVRRVAGARLAEGGFAKGLALDAALSLARGVSGVARVELDFGGQLAWWNAASVRCGITAPRDRSRILAHLDLPAAGSVATSGNGERGLVVAGRRRSHLIDPRTGQPAPDWGAVTVLVTEPAADAAAVADCMSTALYVLGPDAGFARAAALEGVEALFVEQRRGGLRWHLTAGMRDRVRDLPAGAEVRLR